MTKAIQHETDKGKWQSSFDDYAHGEGNGKSRNAIYKHFNKIHKEPKEIKESELIEEPEIIPVEETGQKWNSAKWMDDSIEEDVKTKTIPEPLADMASGKIREVDLKAQGQIVRSLFVGLDRLVTHWGRGTMSDDSWSIDRTPEDYDVLQNATVNMLTYYNVRIPISPPMIWGVTIGSAYVPQITHVMKNRDPFRKKRSFLPRWLRRKPKKIVGDELNE
tara:strand:+ start:441 stop:1097 length:657 start_codon:yes stop_codon:yes gene_type:complete